MAVFNPLLIQPVDTSDETFWSQFWSESITNIQDVFALIPAAEIRVLREECPSNLATLCYKAVEQLVHAADSSCATQLEHTTGKLIDIEITFHLLSFVLECSYQLCKDSYPPTAIHI